MADRFKLNGVEVEDNILFYWSVLSLSRSLRFASEAEQQISHPDNGAVLATIAAYYSLFHLGSFLCCCSAPKYLTEETRSKFKKALASRKDPTRKLTHKEVSDYMLLFEPDGLPKTVRAATLRARRLREFVNYGPNLRHGKTAIRIFNRTFHPEESKELINSLESVFFDGVNWAWSQKELDGELALVAIDMAAAYFTPNSSGDPFYSNWSSAPVLARAEAARQSLYLKISER
jgi:hypothetical protein